MLIIGDIAGQYKSFISLLRKVPDTFILSVGDIIDRGINSKDVVEWFMSHQDCSKVLLGNHEQMCIDNYKKYGIYPEGCWIQNGGIKTLDSFGWYVPENVIEWMDKLSLYHITEDKKYIISHSFIHPELNLEESCRIVKERYSYQHSDFDKSIIWNRDDPIRREYFQIVGHNSPMGLKYFSDNKGQYALCLDTSKSKILTGLHLETMTIYQQEYID